MYPLGWSFSCIVVPRLGDLYGRRRPYLISAGIAVVCYLGLLFSHSLDFTMVLFFILGLCTPGKSNINYVYTLELVPAKWQTYTGTAMICADGSSLILVSLYFRYISKEWLGFQVFTFCFSTLCYIGTLFAPESPRYLYSF